MWHRAGIPLEIEVQVNPNVKLKPIDCALLLEVDCGRRPIESNASPEEIVLVERVWNKFREGQIIDVVDTRFNGQYDEDEMLIVLTLGLICSKDMLEARTSTRQVVRYLDREAELHSRLII
ncbi:hypothetical protein DITRI_Ditri12bG0169800 [Diplodiscus trichospermus]